MDANSHSDLLRAFLCPRERTGKKPAKPANTPLELTEADRTFIELREAARKNDAPRAQQLAASLPNYIMGDYVEYFKIKPQLFDAGAMARAETTADSQVMAFLSKYEGTASQIVCAMIGCWYWESAKTGVRLMRNTPNLYWTTIPQ
jgi:hypothetical protein